MELEEVMDSFKKDDILKSLINLTLKKKEQHLLQVERIDKIKASLQHSFQEIVRWKEMWKMIERDCGVYVLVCDNCGEEILGLSSYQQAQEYKEENNWRSVPGATLNLKDGVMDLCPSCSRK